MKFKKLLIYAFTLNLSLASHCTTGCLRCEPSLQDETESMCVLCDTLNNYFLKEGTCVFKEVNKCVLLGDSGKCFECEKGYYLDNGKCTIVTAVIPYCVHYSSDGACTLCSTGKYLEVNECLIVSTVIDNCLFYSSSTLCSQCEQGYYINTERTTCTALPNVCAAYRNYTCEECSEGYIKNKDYYKEIDYQYKTHYQREFLISLINYYNENLTFIYEPEVCQLITAEYCDVALSSTQCLSCIDGYYLDENQICSPYPDTKISSCKIYQALTYENHGGFWYRCIECYDGYFLEDWDKCTAVTIVQQDNCSNWDTTASTQICVDCNPGYYLKNDKTCEPYDKGVIANCQTYKSSEYGCAQCYSGYLLSVNEEYCNLMDIDNCSVYDNVSNLQTTTLKCAQCDNGYYLSSTVSCTQYLRTDKDNCLNTYVSENQNKCKKCKDQYFINTDANDYCTLVHPTITNCDTYYTHSDFSCETCDSGFTPLQIVSYCKIRNTLIDNCATYAVDDSCTSCEDGYFLSAQICHEFTDKYCKASNTNNDTCSECLDGYYFLNNECTNKIPAYLDQCENLANLGTQTSYTLNSTSACQNCKDGGAFIQIQDVCVQQEVFTGVITTDLEDCERQKSNGECVLCRGEAPFFYDDVGTRNCVQECPSANTHIPVDLRNGALYNQINCSPTYDTEVLLAGMNLRSQDYTYSNVLCRNSVNFISTSTATNETITNIDGKNGIFQNYIPHPLFVSPNVSCIAFDATKRHNGQLITKLDESMQRDTYWIIEGDNNYYQVKCTFGEVGLPTLYNTHHYLACSSELLSKNDTYEQETMYYNIPAHWSKFFSIHKCSTDSGSSHYIPVLAYQSTALTDQIFDTFQVWALTVTGGTRALTNWTEGTNAANNIECIDVSSASTIASALDVQDGGSNIVAMENCGLGFLNTKFDPANFSNAAYATSTINAAPEAFGCAACSPGYKQEIDNNGAAWNQNNVYTVRNCQPIANCKSDLSQVTVQFYNACPQCADNYLWKYSANQVYFDECVSIAGETKTKNCLAWDSTNKKCGYCEKGFVVTNNGFCVTNQHVPYCNNYVAEYALAFDQRISTYLYQKGAGCIECQDGYFGIRLNNRVNICTLFEDSPITHCNKYNGTQCEECEDNYMTTVDTSQASIITACSTIVSNCLRYDSHDQECLNCKPGYTRLTDGTCLLSSIDHCTSYDTDGSTLNSKAKCEQCEDYYYLENNKCYRGYIPNCKVYSAKDNCSQCRQEYFPVTFNLKNMYCIKINVDHDQCDDWSFNQVTTNGDVIMTASCGGCVDEEYKVIVHDDLANVEEKYLTYCSEVTLVEECIDQFFTRLQMDVETLSCNECSKLYYLNTTKNKFICEQRLYVDNFCKTYDIERDMCSECMTGYYLSTNNQYCIPNPTATYKCIVFDDSLTCQLCMDGYYLLDKQCYEVPEENLIVSCLYYSDKVTCQQCQEHKHLFENECYYEIVGCAKYDSATSCAQCNELYALQIVNQQGTCAQPISQCIYYTPEGACEKCASQYYLGEAGTCVSVGLDAITHCIYYSKSINCTQCEEGYALSQDQTKCYSIEENCLSATYNLECSVCQAGHSFIDGICVQNISSSIIEGCYDQDPEGKCIFCLSGWFMEENQICVNNYKVEKKFAMIILFLKTIFMLIF